MVTGHSNFGELVDYVTLCVLKFGRIESNRIGSISLLCNPLPGGLLKSNYLDYLRLVIYRS